MSERAAPEGGHGQRVGQAGDVCALAQAVVALQDAQGKVLQQL